MGVVGKESLAVGRSEGSLGRSALFDDMVSSLGITCPYLK